MCVICRKARGAKLPSAEIIAKMWETNPDGAGVMWREVGQIHWIKGFMDYEGFALWLEQNRERLNGTECALHFRITTHGGTNKKNCHPFPLDGQKVHLLSGAGKAVMMHNGVLPIVPRSTKFSDTAELALRVYESNNPRKYINAISEFVAESNRLCIFHRKGTLLIGNWLTRGDGCDYSNLNFAYFHTFGRRLQTAPGTHNSYHPYYDRERQVWCDCYGNYTDVTLIDPGDLTDEDYKQYEVDMEGYCENTQYVLQ